MKHHFGDMLDREGDYWTMVPNRERYAYSIGEIPVGSKEITIVTIGRDEENWERVFTLPNIEELTLHEPTREQLVALSKLSQLKRLRITHARPKDIEFLGELTNVEELVFEYVSGFSDLSPLRRLTKLKALHIENLRKVKSFDGLKGILNLRYLHIDGTMDWKQPIENFMFLEGLPALEVLSLGQIITQAPFPAMLPVLSLHRLNKIKISGNMLAAQEYALLSVGLENVDGANFEAINRVAHFYVELPNNDLRAHLPKDLVKKNHPEVIVYYDGTRKIADPKSEWFEFIGKGAGRAKCTSLKAVEKCAKYEAEFEKMKQQASALIGIKPKT